MFAFRLAGAWMRGISRGARMAFVFAVAVAAGHLTNVGQIGLEAAALGGINTLAVTPSHGRAAASFLAVYQITPCVVAPAVSIEFSWNGLPPGAGQVLGTAPLGSNCRASLSVTPPLNPATHAAPPPGSYFVYGFVPLPTGGPTIGTEASATYIVDVTPTPTATPTATPTSTSTATAGPSASARSTASAAPSGSPALSASASSPATSGQPSASAASSARTSPTSVHKAPLTLGWWRSVGGLLLLGAVSLAVLLLALLTLLILDRIEKRRARSTHERARDKAA